MTNIHKGESISLDQSQFDISRVSIGLGWDVREKDEASGLLGKLIKNRRTEDYDMDVVAFLLDEEGKLNNLGYNKEVSKGHMVPLVGSDIIHFNNLSLPDGSISHTGDNPDGRGPGDDERILVQLPILPVRYHKILFIASLFKGITRKQHFGMINNAFIRATDAEGKEMVRYNLSDEPEYNLKRSMIFAELYRQDSGWNFRALGTAYPSDSFVDIMRDYVRYG